MNIPFFSIIVSCCNVQQYIYNCLYSISNQTFTNWECIIGIEQSQDNTEQIIKQKIAKDSRFKFFTNKKSGSCSLTRNIGIDMAQGEYVIFLDGDDWFLNSQCLFNIFNKIQQNPDADLYPSIMVTSQGEVRDNYLEDTPKEMTGPEAINYIANRKDRFYCPQLQLTIYKRSFLIQHNLKCIVGLRNQDSQFSPRALYYAKKVVPLHIPFYYYNRREGSVQTSVKNRTQLNKDWSIIYNSLIKFYGEEKIKDSQANIFWVKYLMRSLHFKFFSPYTLQNCSRKDRVEHLKFIFKGKNLYYYAKIISRRNFKQKVMFYMMLSYLFIPFSRFIIQFAVKKYYNKVLQN